VPAYHCIDNARFVELLERTKPRVDATRSELGLGDGPVVLFVGRLLERKGGDDLIAAVAELQRARPDVRLVFVGDGPLRAEWEALAAVRLRSGTFRFAGSRPLDELPLYYQLADVFVLPSHEEVWGLVVNEAALAGLPVVVSETCGAAPDLVEPGVNGARVRPGDVPALAAALADILRADGARRRMGAESRRLVERCTPAKVAAALLEAASLGELAATVG
jgi:1,2-diacylglycerol 3-alpha-glucosyltransferase